MEQQTLDISTIDRTCIWCHTEKKLHHFSRKEQFKYERDIVCKSCRRKAGQQAANERKRQLKEAAERRAAKMEFNKKQLCLKGVSLRRNLVYVSLPIGYGREPHPEQLKAAKTRANEAKRALMQLGYDVITPFDLAIPAHYTYKSKLQMCLDALEKSRPIIYLLDGWRNSLGCNAEKKFAEELGLTIEQEQENGLEWLSQRAETFCIHPKCALVI
jgi:hypothetical protein